MLKTHEHNNSQIQFPVQFELDQNQVQVPSFLFFVQILLFDFHNRNNNMVSLLQIQPHRYLRSEKLDKFDKFLFEAVLLRLNSFQIIVQ